MVLNNHKINDLILLKQNENAKECTTNMSERLNKNIDQFFVINNHDNEEDKHSKESTSTIIESVLEPAGGSIIQSHRETCRICLRQQIGTVTDWTTRSRNSWHSSRSDNSCFF